MVWKVDICVILMVWGVLGDGFDDLGCFDVCFCNFAVFWWWF